MIRKTPPTARQRSEQKSGLAGTTGRFITCTMAIATLLGGILTTSLAQAASKPNIVLIVVDDLDATTSEYWERATDVGKDDPLKKTRALLKDQGVTFLNAFAPTPICCPARATILTGKYGHNTGVLTNAGSQGGMGAFNGNGNDAKTIAVQLKRDAGYATGMIGKYMNGIADVPGYVPPGWTEFNAFYDKGVESYLGYDYDMGVYNEDTSRTREARVVHFGTAESDYSTDVVARQSVDFINRRSKSNKPFFLYVAPTAPHLPLPAAPRHMLKHPYAGLSVQPPKRPNYNEPNIGDKSFWLTESSLPRAALVDIWNPIDYRLRQGSLYALDDLVESVVKSLEANGVLNNTYIVFVSDNGYNLGAHRLIHKMAPYEESIRVPFVVRGPNIPAKSNRSSMVLHTDIAPTIATWAGLGIPSDVDGRSLTEITGSSTPANWRKDFFIQYVGPTAGQELGILQEIPGGHWAFGFTMDVPSYRALRNERYTYVEYNQSLIGLGLINFKQYELYDNINDPFQLNNLLSTISGKIRYAGKKYELSSRMDTLSTCTGISCRN